MIYVNSTSIALRVGNEKVQTLYAVSIVVLGWCIGQKFLFSAALPYNRYPPWVEDSINVDVR